MAFLRDVADGKAADPLALADAVDAELGPLVALARSIAEAPEAFRTRKAIELASMLVEKVENADLVDETQESAS